MKTTPLFFISLNGVIDKTIGNLLKFRLDAPRNHVFTNVLVFGLLLHVGADSLCDVSVNFNLLQSGFIEFTESQLN